MSFRELGHGVLLYHCTKIVFDQTRDHTPSNKRVLEWSIKDFISDAQFGFKPGLSTIPYLHELIPYHINKGGIVLLLCRLQKNSGQY